MKITIGYIYPELLNMFGDKGNITALYKRLKWRGIEAEIKEISVNDAINFEGLDIVYIGGGGEKEIIAAKEKLFGSKEKLAEYVEDNGVLLCVCSGYELVSKEFYLKGKKEEGLGILNTKAKWCDKRFVSNVVLETDYGTVAGFENHNGRMDIGILKPLGKVVCGNGNNGEDNTEGVIYKNTFATYLDGPILPKNPKLCDEIIKRALLKKYQDDIILNELDDSAENAANSYIVNKYTKNI